MITSSGQSQDKIPDPKATRKLWPTVRKIGRRRLPSPQAALPACKLGGSEPGKAEKGPVAAPPAKAATVPPVAGLPHAKTFLVLSSYIASYKLRRASDCSSCAFPEEGLNGKVQAIHQRSPPTRCCGRRRKVQPMLAANDLEACGEKKRGPVRFHVPQFLPTTTAHRRAVQHERERENKKMCAKNTHKSLWETHRYCKGSFLWLSIKKLTCPSFEARSVVPALVVSQIGCHKLRLVQRLTDAAAIVLLREQGEGRKDAKWMRGSKCKRFPKCQGWMLQVVASPSAAAGAP